MLRGGTGFLKVIVDKDTGRILRAMLFCGESHEILNLVKQAGLDTPYRTLRDGIDTRPAMSKVLGALFAGSGKKGYRKSWMVCRYGGLY